MSLFAQNFLNKFMNIIFPFWLYAISCNYRINIIFKSNLLSICIHVKHLHRLIANNMQFSLKNTTLIMAHNCGEILFTHLLFMFSIGLFPSVNLIIAYSSVNEFGSLTKSNVFSLCLSGVITISDDFYDFWCYNC